MEALTQFLIILVEDKDKLAAAIEVVGANKPVFYERYVGTLLQQLAEKIDRVREVAGRQLQIFFKRCSNLVCQFAERDELTGLFIQESEYVQDGGAIESIIHD